MHNEFKKCTLACARCTDNKYKLALINTQRNTVESMSAIRVRFRHIYKINHKVTFVL